MSMSCKIDHIPLTFVSLFDLCDRFDDWFTIKFISTHFFVLSLQFFQSIATHRMLRDARASTWASDLCIFLRFYNYDKLFLFHHLLFRCCYRMRCDRKKDIGEWECDKKFSELKWNYYTDVEPRWFPTNDN